MSKSENRKKSVMESINKDSVKPKSKKYFLTRNSGFIAILVIFSIIGVILVGSFLFDLFELIRIYNDFGIVDSGLFIHTFYEFVFISIALCLLDLYIYRRTDWPLVRKPNTVFAIMVIGTLIGGFMFSFVGEGMARASVENFQKLNIHKNRGEIIRDRLENRGVYFGKVIDIDEETVLVETKKGTKNFNKAELSELKSGDLVSIKVNKDGSYKVNTIKRIPKPLTYGQIISIRQNSLSPVY